MRVLAVNDISCIGRCSLTVTLPILSACGVECDVLPTALLSTHTGGFENYTFRDLTDEIPSILAHWKTLGIKFDCICSGYLGNIKQIDLVTQIKREFLKETGIFIVDPVMGDSGKLYTGFSAPYVEKMCKLCRLADYILPNATEACYLAGEPYPLDENSLPAVFKRLQALCPRPVVTGVSLDGAIRICYADEQGELKTYSHENVEGFFCGAGDVFASAFAGALLKGRSDVDAVRLASDFTFASILRSSKEVEDRRFGLNFEAEIFPFLQNLNAFR